MDETMLRLALELPLRERVRRAHRCPPSLEDIRLTEAQADIIDGVIAEVLDAVGLSDEQHERAIDLTVEALLRAAGEDPHDDPHDDPMVSTDQGGYHQVEGYQR